MKGYRFYLEHASNKDKRDGVDMGVVIAVYTGDGGYRGWHDTHLYNCLSAVTSHPNPDTNQVGWASCDAGFIAQKCRRISEAEARKIHPNLFVILGEQHD